MKLELQRGVVGIELGCERGMTTTRTSMDRAHLPLLIKGNEVSIEASIVILGSVLERIRLTALSGTEKSSVHQLEMHQSFSSPPKLSH